MPARAGPWAAKCIAVSAAAAERGLRDERRGGGTGRARRAILHSGEHRRGLRPPGLAPQRLGLKHAVSPCLHAVSGRQLGRPALAAAGRQGLQAQAPTYGLRRGLRRRRHVLARRVAACCCAAALSRVKGRGRLGVATLVPSCRT